MKFLFVSANQGGGGSEELWIQTAGWLRNLGHKVHAVTEWKTAAVRRLDQLDSFNVSHSTADPTGGGAIINKVTERIFRRQPWNQRNLRSILKSLRPDLVIFNSGTLVDGISLLQVIQDEQVPYVVVTHLVSTDNWPNDDLATRIHTLFSRAIETCFVSQHNLELYTLQTGRKLINSSIVRNPFLVKGAQIPMPEQNEGTPVRLALPARLHPKTKGQDMLFSVLSRPEWQVRNIQVSLFGTGSCEDSLRRLRSELGLGNKVVFAGHVEDMDHVWLHHHALVLPSRHEGLPIAQIEAMIAGRTVIATPAGGIPEMMKPGQTGYLASACEVEALHRAMDEAWSQRDRWGSLGEAGRELVRSRIPADPVKSWGKHLADLADSQRGRI
ncbi:MAG: glycosyltransferase family 4 protein [Prosthecobacter sp.]|uniref:glycosyltransferase family 4 protein n=1 Tax=Prosthecobacter sp. TaxID=1965333 RepID=UPI0019DC0F69|nr:glycosyltransferase family 4 protein [Prosthecobacter sp.]MBE2286392.1 glycosyltransferase family 4 protein [Prosthecobacter sp.]